ncbi:unnamed protein product [Diatraea saccharalis]|uniref:Uncharacterized protein n=1 Tax=Diatraea saccharalis TaxID=40085 RepID=A0A9N9QVA3_9NEOP|nr:unnamed protein product [Diatraea saccharalis]
MTTSPPPPPPPPPTHARTGPTLDYEWRDSRQKIEKKGNSIKVTIVSGDNGRGAAAWVRRWWRALVAEVISTALLVLLGVATLMTKEPIVLTHPALAFGFVVLMNVEAFGPASGAHMNPAVTLAALLYGKMGAALAGAYAVAQVAGAVVGFGLLRALAPAGLAATAGCTGTALHPAAAAAVEALLTGTLVLLCCGLWAAHDDARPDRAVSIKLGCGIAGLVYAGVWPPDRRESKPGQKSGPGINTELLDKSLGVLGGPAGRRGGGGAAASVRAARARPRPRPRAPRRGPASTRQGVASTSPIFLIGIDLTRFLEEFSSRSLTADICDRLCTSASERTSRHHITRSS